MPAALIADDEPLLRDRLAAQLARLWPSLEIVALARNGREAIELFDQHLPAVVFLDVHMPGLNGVEAGRAMARRTRLVFVTAHEQYALQAFEQGAIDYLVKPVDEGRLAETVSRLRPLVESPAVTAGATRGAAPPAADPVTIEQVLEQMARELARRESPRRWLAWIKASVGQAVRLIPCEQVIYLRSDEKYTLVVWDGGEALIRRTVRELADELDPDEFAQVHRSVIVNLRRVRQVTRGPNETAEVQLLGRDELLPVSRSYLHLFRQM